MRGRTYFRWAFALPLVLPAVLFLIAKLIQQIVGTNEPTLLWHAAGLLVAPLLVAGIPYVLFYAGVLWWSRSKTTDDLWRFAWVSPLVFAVLFVAVSITFGVVAHPGGGLSWLADGGLKGIGIFVLFCLGFGYAYVALIQGGYYALRHVGRIEADVESV